VGVKEIADGVEKGTGNNTHALKTRGRRRGRSCPTKNTKDLNGGGGYWWYKKKKMLVKHNYSASV